MGDHRPIKSRHDGLKAEGSMENRPSNPPNHGRDTGLEPLQDKETRLLGGQGQPTLLPAEVQPAGDADDGELGSTRVLSPEEEQVLAVHEQQQRAAIPIGRAGSVLGDFQIVKQIGEGAMGAVYLARQPTFENRLVALKVLFPHVASNQKLVNRLYREAEVMFDLDHPNIVKSFGVDESDGWHYIAMEYIEGDSLQKWINQLGQLPIGDAVHIALACAHALGHAHANGLIHRDIKPDNVLISRSGKVKITDLGMVKKLDEDEEKGLTMTGHAVGTPWYMPLEQAKNAKSADPRCDIYALGCMLYCMLAGHPPFSGHTIVEVIQAKEIGTFPPARSFNKQVPEKLDLILAKMVQKLPKYRYQTCAEVIEALQELGLANRKLTLVGDASQPRTDPKAAPATPSMAATTATTSVSQDTDSEKWYVRLRNSEGQYVVKTMLRPQLAKMVEEGTLGHSVNISRNPHQGFRALATYKEFQHVALGRANKHPAPSQQQEPLRYQNLFNQIEKREMKREKEKNVEYTSAGYWLPILGAARRLPAALAWSFSFSTGFAAP